MYTVSTLLLELFKFFKIALILMTRNIILGKTKIFIVSHVDQYQV